MKKRTFFFAFCFFSLFIVAFVHAQQGEIVWQQSHTGESLTITVRQALALPHRSPAILRGNIIQHLCGDRYLFRDPSGEIVIIINTWRGLYISPTDFVEIGGELRQSNKNRQAITFDVMIIRIVI